MPSRDFIDRPQLSVVVPLFNEEENLHPLYQRLVQALAPLTDSYEILFVDDGSSDATGQMLHELAQTDRRVVPLPLTRNFGHQAAVTAGLDQARGNAVVVMDGDLQDPPEVIPQFWKEWKQGSEVVFAIRAKRKEGILRRGAYALFYRILRHVSDISIPLDSGDFCLMDRKVVLALRSLPERIRFVRGLRAYVGFRQTGVRVERDARAAGRPKYTLRALMRLALDGIVGFSSLPLRLATYGGVASMGLGLLTGLATVSQVVWSGDFSLGFGGLLTAVLMVGGMQLMALGIIGEYLRGIFLECKQRPSYLIRPGHGNQNLRRRPNSRRTGLAPTLRTGTASRALRAG